MLRACYEIRDSRKSPHREPSLPPWNGAWQRAPIAHHVLDLAVPVAEDDGVGGVAHRQHHSKGDRHGNRDQGVEWIDVQCFRLEERIHSDLNFENGQAFSVRECDSLVLNTMSWE